MHHPLRSHHLLTNFGGNIRFRPQHFYAPTSEREVLDILDRHANAKIRVVGSLHSWSPAVVTDDTLVDMRHFRSVQLQRSADGSLWATVGGGCRIKHVLRKLRLHRVTMPSIGLITAQTIAGAISTATHGSGKHSLSHYVDELRVAAYDPATGAARVVVLSDGDERRAGRCALGCMGIILSVRFRCIPLYDVAETIVACTTLDEVLEGEGRFPLQQFYLIPHLWSYLVQRRLVPREPQRTRPVFLGLYRAWWLLGIDIGLHLVIKLLVTGLGSPGATRWFYRHILTRLVVKNATVVDRSERMLVMAHDLFQHLEIELFVPARNIRRAAQFVRSVIEVFAGTMSVSTGEILSDLAGIGMVEELRHHHGSYTHHYPITFRRVLVDDALIAMSAGTDEPWYALSFITFAQPHDRFLVLATFLARAMARLFQARLHWGKVFPLDGAEIEGSYPRLATFRTICRQFDPKGVFRNTFTDRVLFGSE